MTASDQHVDEVDGKPLLAEYHCRRSAHGHLMYRLFPEHVEYVVFNWRGQLSARRRIALAQLYDLYEDTEAPVTHRYWKLWCAAVVGIALVITYLAWDSLFLMSVYLGVAALAIGTRFTPQSMEHWALFPAPDLKSHDHALAIVQCRSRDARDDDFRQFVSQVQRQIRACRQSRDLEVSASIG
jgi:hypothetical protein